MSKLRYIVWGQYTEEHPSALAIKVCMTAREAAKTVENATSGFARVWTETVEVVAVDMAKVGA